jgi:hypothetical protein
MIATFLFSLAEQSKRFFLALFSAELMAQIEGGSLH